VTSEHLPVPALPAAWRAEADRLERFAPAAAVAFRDAAIALEGALRSEADELLTLTEAARASGHSSEHLRHLVASGAIANAGRKGAPRIRRCDLPRKACRATPSLYDVDADARQLAQAGRR
jgi:hypothetical protein